MIKVLLTLKIILLKIIKLNLAFLKNQTSGYPDFVDKFEKILQNLLVSNMV
jgi:hypothetical protein